MRRRTRRLEGQLVPEQGKQVRDPKGIWYTPTTGVWQTVWIEPVGLVHVESLRVDPDPKSEAVEVVVDAPRATPEEKVEIDVLDGGRVLATGRGRSSERIRIAPRRAPVVADDPFLYDLEVRLVRGPVLEDRSLLLRHAHDRGPEGREGRPRLALNGSPLFEIGVLDQGFGRRDLHRADGRA
jgi:hypothetical protein